VFTGKGVVAAKQAGARNPVADKRNQAVIKNPSLAKGAVLPKPSASKAAPNAGPNGNVKQQTKSTPEPQANSNTKSPAKPAEPPRPAEHNPETNEHKNDPGERE
jgi:hypothetical protein